MLAWSSASQVVAESDASATIEAYYVRGDDLLAVLRLAGARFYHSDGLGSVRLLTDESHTVTDRYIYSAFGELLEHVGSHENAFLFAGEQVDANAGFYYLRTRWMDPRAGRFVTMDSFGGFASDPITLHKYIYANADPVNNTDPEGLLGLPSFSVASAINSTISAIVSFSVSKAIDITIATVTGQQIQLFEVSDLIALIPIGGLLGVLLKRGKAVIGPLAARGKDLELVRSFAKTFAATGGQFVRRLPNGKKIVLKAGVVTDAEKGKSTDFLHLINRHILDYFKGIPKGSNTMWPRGTTGSKVVRYLDEAIKKAGTSLKPGWNENIKLKNGIVTRMFLGSKYNVKSFHPVSGPGVFELKGHL